MSATGITALIKIKNFESTVVKFCSSEGHIVETSLKCAKMSLVIQDMLKSLEEKDSPVVPLTLISTKTVRFIVEWMEKHQNDPQPTSQQIKTIVEEKINQWDENFIQKDLKDVFEIVRDRNKL